MDERKVAAIRGGTSYVPDVPSTTVAELVTAGRLTAVSDFAVIATLACPGLIDNRSRPRVRGASSCLHRKSAHASANLRDEVVVLLLTESSSNIFSNAMPRWSEHVPQAELTFPHATRFGGTVPRCKMCRVLRSEDESRYQKLVQAMNRCPQQFSRMVAAGNVLASKMRTGSHIYPVGSQPVILKGLGLTHRVLQSMDAEHQPAC